MCKASYLVLWHLTLPLALASAFWVFLFLVSLLRWIKPCIAVSVLGLNTLCFLIGSQIQFPIAVFSSVVSRNKHCWYSCMLHLWALVLWLGLTLLLIGIMIGSNLIYWAYQSVLQFHLLRVISWLLSLDFLKLFDGIGCEWLIFVYLQKPLP